MTPRPRTLGFKSLNLHVKTIRLGKHILKFIVYHVSGTFLTIQTVHDNTSTLFLLILLLKWCCVYASVVGYADGNQRTRGSQKRVELQGMVSHHQGCAENWCRLSGQGHTLNHWVISSASNYGRFYFVVQRRLSLYRSYTAELFLGQQCWAAALRLWHFELGTASTFLESFWKGSHHQQRGLCRTWNTRYCYNVSPFALKNWKTEERGASIQVGGKCSFQLDLLFLGLWHNPNCLASS